MARRGSKRSHAMESWGRRFYRVLLFAYPRTFREASGDEAAALFGEACRADWDRRGVRAVLRRALHALVNVPMDGLAERRASGRDAAADSPVGGTHASGPGLAADLRHAWRAVRRRPALSIAIVATLGVGIGVNTAVFGVIDATLLRPLPYVDAGRVVYLKASPPSGRATDPDPGTARAWTADASNLIARSESFWWRSVLITGAGAATRERLIEATPGYLSAIGAHPILGRLLTAADSEPGAAPVVVISAAMWHARFGGRADIVGVPLAIDGMHSVIVGVASQILADVAGVELRIAAPLASHSHEPARTAVWLRPHVSLERAQAQLDAVPAAGTDVGPLRPRLVRESNLFWSIAEFRTIDLAALAAGWLVLIIAGINVANMLLAAGQTRVGELTVRRALGASPTRLVRLLLLETAMRALAGAALGLALAWGLTRWIATLDAGPQWQTALERIHLDPLVATYTLSVALMTALAAGLVPALRSARADASVRRALATRAVSGMRRGASILLAVETGLSALLLVASGLVAHAFLSMRLVDPGFDADRVLHVRLELPASSYPSSASRKAFFDKLIDVVSRLPGVERAGLGYGSSRPSDFVVPEGEWIISGSTRGPVEAGVRVDESFVTPGYFALMGIPLLQGEDFRPGDLGLSPDAAQPTVVSRSLVDRLWPDGSAVGTDVQIVMGTRTWRYHVIGVARDVRAWGLFLPRCVDCDPTLYLPLPERRYFTDVLVRASPGAALPRAELRAAVAHIDPGVPSDDELESASERLDEFISRPRFMATIFSVVGGLAVLLVAIGLAAVVSHAVVQRTREMGIRLALGAKPATVRRLVLLQGLRPALVGLAAGMACALALTRYLRSLLYGLSPTDPITMAVVPVLVITIVILAIVVPALRASQVDPITALRAE